MTRLRTLALALLVSTVFVGCGDDNPTDPGTTLTLAIVSGNNQVGEPGAALAAPLTVEVSDQGGNLVSGQSVNWVLASAAGPNSNLSASTAFTGTDGRASVSFTLGDAVGTYEVRASVPGSASTFSAEAAAAGCTSVLDLQPGEDALIAGEDFDCVLLPPHAAGAEYELAVTPLPEALGFNAMTLVVEAAALASSAPGDVPPVPGTAQVAAFSRLGSASELTSWRGPQYEWDMQIREMEKPLRPAIRANAVRGSSFGLSAAAPLLGDVMDFGFSCVSQTQFPNTPTDITAEVVAVSNNAVIFEDTLSRGAFTAGEYGDIAFNFDSVIIGTDTLYFGALADVTGDIAPGQVVILYTQGVNQMTEDYSDGFIAGFFCPQDLGFAGGNNAKMFYLLVPDPGGDLTPGSDANLLTKENTLRITDNTAAHELQHLINAQVGTGAAAEVGINEGLSHVAEEVVGHATGQVEGIANFAPGNELGADDFFQSQAALDVLNKYYLGNWVNLGFYLHAPGDTAALLNAEDPLGGNTFRMRGANWSFLRYLLDRFGAPATEWQQTRALITDAATNSRQAVTNVFGVSFNELVADWAAMLSVEDRDDLGGPVRASLATTSYQMRDIYDDPAIGGIASPTGSWPLMPQVRLLGQSSTVDMELFTATSSFVTLRAAAATGGTRLRLVETGSGDDLSPTIMPYMVIVRTK